MIDDAMLLNGLLIFLAEVAVLTLGTVRTIVTVQRESRIAFILGVLEMLLWVSATSAVVAKVAEAPFLGLCYAVGFATGNVVGIYVEQKLALGRVVMRIISRGRGPEIAQAVRSAGYGITSLSGHGTEGPVSVQLVLCRRKDLKEVVETVKEADKDVFYTLESAVGSSNVHVPERKRFRRIVPGFPM